MKKTNHNQKKDFVSKTGLGKIRMCHLMILCSLLAIPNAGQTSQITIAIAGTVRIVDDPWNILAGAVHPGDTITGIYTYESTTPDDNPFATVGDYWHTTAPYGISVTVAGLTFRTDPNNVNFLVEIGNDHAPGISPTDNYLLRSYNNLFDVSAPSEPFGPPFNHISWQLDDPTATALSSTDLPVVAPVLADWQSLFGLDIFSSAGPGGHFGIRADVTSAVLVEVDTDADGVPDNRDECGDTPAGAIVDGHGCSINQLAPCAGPRSGGNWASHGSYVSAVAEAAEAFRIAGLITQEQKDAIVATAAQSDCGK
jgi:hypothetical protein